MHPASRLGAGLLIVASLWSLSVTSSRAAEFRGEQTITIREGERLQDDLYAVGEAIHVDGTVDGDIFAAALEVVVRGRVTGSVFAVAQRVEISGAVDGDVRVAAQWVRVSGPIGGDLIAGGQTITLDGGGSVGRDALTIGQVVTLDGPVERAVRGAGEEVRLNGVVGGSVDLLGVETLALGSRARIVGDLTYQSAQEAQREDGAEVRGRVTRRDPPQDRPAEPADRLGGTIFGILAVTIVGAAALAISPRGTLAAGTAVVRQALLSLGWGFGLLVGIPIFAVMLLFTFVGIPLALVVLVLYGILLYSSQAIVALGVGRLLLSQLRPVDGAGWSLASILVGSLILGALRSLPVIDAITTFVVLVLGLGGMCLAYLEARSAAAVSTVPAASSPPAS